MKISEFLILLLEAPETIGFNNTIDTIDSNYVFTPAAFQNGELYNEANQNSGSCKIFSFASDQQLTQEQTLTCFGDYYRKDVLENPDAKDHQNIRNFMRFGWSGIQFEGIALVRKNIIHS
jgi:hypothetical protein